MKYSSSWVILWAISISCNHSKTLKTRPSDYFSKGQENALLLEIVRNTIPQPKGGTNAEEAKIWYNEQLKAYQWHYAHEENGRFYYFVSRPAPSLYGKRMGIGGSFSSPDRLTITGFKEVFQTYKMKPDDLLTKGVVLFEKMVNQAEQFTNKSVKMDKSEWVELPDSIHYYDSVSHAWKEKPGS